MSPILFKLLRAGMPTVQKMGVPPPMSRRARAKTPTSLRIAGVTKTGAAVALGSCTLKLYRTSDDSVVASTVSDASGNYEFRGISPLTEYYIAGGPPVSGTTINTLTGK